MAPHRSNASRAGSEPRSVAQAGGVRRASTARTCPTARQVCGKRSRRPPSNRRGCARQGLRGRGGWMGAVSPRRPRPHVSRGTSEAGPREGRADRSAAAMVEPAPGEDGLTGRSKVGRPFHAERGWSTLAGAAPRLQPGGAPPGPRETPARGPEVPRGTPHGPEADSAGGLGRRLRPRGRRGRPSSAIASRARFHVKHRVPTSRVRPSGLRHPTPEVSVPSTRRRGEQARGPERS